MNLAKYFVYILRCQKSRRLYTGYTTNPSRRLDEHNAGESFATKPYGPWELVFCAGFETENMAKSFERYLKAGSGKAFAYKRLVIR
jgi:putative endonuclease